MSLFNIYEARVFGIRSEKLSYKQAEIDYGYGKTARKLRGARRNGRRKEGDGYKYRGRGFVQITWRINYENFNGLNGINFGETPEKALDFDTQILMTVEGMEQGLFKKGHSLSRYLNDDKKDYIGARQIINGIDKNWVIEHYAKEIEKCLIKSKL